MIRIGSSPSSVAFPGSELHSPQRQAQKPVPQLKGPHLPFRRISLPSAPSLPHRASIASVLSFDLLAEQPDRGSTSSSPSSPTRAPAPAATPQTPRSKGRQSSVESPRRKSKVRESTVKPMDEKKTAKRQKIIEEFLETEKAYVDGLELIYSVSSLLPSRTK